LLKTILKLTTKFAKESFNLEVLKITKMLEVFQNKKTTKT
jgi:hypothetical protein